MLNFLLQFLRTNLKCNKLPNYTLLLLISLGLLTGLVFLLKFNILFLILLGLTLTISLVILLYILFKNPMFTLPLLAFSGLGLSKKDIYFFSFLRIGYPYIFLALALIAFFIYFYPKKIKFKISSVSLLIYLLFLWIIVSLLYTRWLYSGLFISITFLTLELSTFLLALIWTANSSIQKIKNILYIITGIALTFILLGIVNELRGPGFQRFNIFSFSPTSLSLVIVLGILIYIVFLKEISQHIPKKINYLLLTISVFVIIASQSKTGLIAFFFTLFIYCLLQKRIKSRYALSIFFTGILVTIILFATIFTGYTSRYRETLKYLMATSDKKPKHSTVTVRIDSFKKQWFPYWFETIFPGTGVGGMNPEAKINRYAPIRKKGSVGEDIHNILSQTWLELGLIGFSLLMLILYIACKNAYKLVLHKNELIHKIGIICFIGISITFISQISGGYIHTMRPLWFFIGITEGIRLNLNNQKFLVSKKKLNALTKSL